MWLRPEIRALAQEGCSRGKAANQIKAASSHIHPLHAIQNGAGDSTTTTGPGPAYSTSPECFTVTRQTSPSCVTAYASASSGSTVSAGNTPPTLPGGVHIKVG